MSKPKERPILFSAPMIRALLDGSKTQTRRVVKWRGLEPGLNLGFSGLSVERSGSNFVLTSQTRTSREYRSVPQPCPYGRPGDRLWCRETWGLHAYGDETNWNTASVAGANDQIRDSWNLTHRSDWGPCQEGCHWRPSIHMPRWASRITLEIESVRVERLQDISEADVAAEGVPCYVCDGPMDGASENDCHCFHMKATASDYRNLWESINGAGSWDANPWVWVVEFKRVKP